MAAFDSLWHTVYCREIPWNIWSFEIHAGSAKYGIHTLAVTGEILGKLRHANAAAPSGRLKTTASASRGPLLDRIDLQVEVPLVDFRELSSTTGGGESSATIRARVAAAREIQSQRFRKSANATNSAMSPRQVKQFCILDSESSGYLEHAMEEMNFSARAHDRILKVARALADSGAENIRASARQKNIVR